MATIATIIGTAQIQNSHPNTSRPRWKPIRATRPTCIGRPPRSTNAPAVASPTINNVMNTHRLGTTNDSQVFVTKSNCEALAKLV